MTKRYLPWRIIIVSLRYKLIRDECLRLTKLIRSSYFNVVSEKVLAVVADPFEHLLAVLLEQPELEALLEFDFLHVPDLE